MGRQLASFATARREIGIMAHISHAQLISRYPDFPKAVKHEPWDIYDMNEVHAWSLKTFGSFGVPIPWPVKVEPVKKPSIIQKLKAFFKSSKE